MNKETRLTKRLYSASAEYERRRLLKDPYHRLEFDTTVRFLKKHLPRNGLALDAGGGPGRYTIALARLGYDVVLLDLTGKLLEIARAKINAAKVAGKVREVVEGSITDLSRYKSNSFDAVLCLGGPLSHVHPESQRKKAVAELVRVAKSRAPIFVSVMGRYGVMLATPGGWPQEVALRKHYRNLAFRGEDYCFRGNAYCHFFTSAELKGMFSREKVDLVEIVGLEGLNVDWKTTIRFARKFPDAWKNWIELQSEMCADPFFVDASGHMLMIVKKK